MSKLMSIGFSKSNSKIDKGFIYNSDIDMNNKVITNHNTPVNPLDVVNKAYCDANSSVFFNVSLSGTLWSNILSSQEGIFRLLIKNNMINGPSATFDICKGSPSRQASIVRINSCHGLTTEERLEIRWLANSGIDLRKDGSGYDGTYTVKYIDNS